MFEKNESSNNNAPQPQHILHEPGFRLNVKKNYKGDIGWEYTVKGETIEEVGARNAEMIIFINKNIEILVKKGDNENLKTDTQG